MEFASRLLRIYGCSDVENDEAAMDESDDGQTAMLESLTAFNEEIEALLATGGAPITSSTSSASQHQENSQPSPESLARISRLQHKLIFQSLRLCIPTGDANDDASQGHSAIAGASASATRVDGDTATSSLPSTSLSPPSSIEEANERCRTLTALLGKQDDSWHPNRLRLGACRTHIRTGKNMLRWYSQIYLEATKPHRQVPGPLHEIQSRDFVALLMHVLESSSRYNHQQQQQQQQEEEESEDPLKLQNYIAMTLFYATYSPAPGDWVADDSLQHLNTTLQFPNRILNLLLRHDSVELALALLRNVHCALVCFPGGRKCISDAEVSWLPVKPGSSSSVTSVASWAPQHDGKVTFRTLLSNIVIHVVKRYQLGPNASQTMDRQSKSPISQDSALRALTEIFNILYAMRYPIQIDDGTTSTQASLSNALVDLLMFSGDDTHAKNCALAVVTLLMDAPAAEFATYLLKRDAVPQLLAILDEQISWMLSNTVVGDKGAAAVTPILVLLYKYCACDPDFRAAVKRIVFPPESDVAIQAEEQKLDSNSSSNMSPLDAPKDTLRWKLVQLLTWTESHVKRFAGELLWILSSSDSKEFIRRVGLGNALPILGVKGLAQIPGS